MGIELDKGVIQALEGYLQASEGKENLLSNVGLVKRNGQWNCLGEGSTAKVYEVVDRRCAEKRYALKISVVKESDLVHMLGNLRVQKRLSDVSENIVKVHDFWLLWIRKDENGKYCVVGTPNRYERSKYEIVTLVLMERLESVLSVNEGGKMTFLNRREVTQSEVLNFAMQIGQAVLELHNRRIVHGDIKLENILFNKKRNCYKLGDFDGMLMEDGADGGFVCKSVGYSMPGVEKQRSKFDERIDIYSLGMCMYLLLNNLCFPRSDGYYESCKPYRFLLPFPAPKYASRQMTKLIRRMCSRRGWNRIKSMPQVMEEINRIREKDND